MAKGRVDAAGYRVAMTKARQVIENPKAFLRGRDECLIALKEDGRYDAIGERYADMIE